MYMSLVRAKLLFFTLQTKEMKVYFSLCSKKTKKAAPFAGTAFLLWSFK